MKPETQPQMTQMNADGPVMLNVQAALLNHPSRIDWGRLAYWIVKFLSLTAMLAAGMALVWAAWLLGAALWNGCAWLASHLSWAATKRVFYSACWMALFFYAVCSLRWLAKLLKAKATNERQARL